MTKYQLVFVKMETAFSKVLNSNKLRDLTQLQKAFYKMKENATEQRKWYLVFPKLLYEKMKSWLLACKQIYESNQKKSLMVTFIKWRKNASLLT